MMSRNAKNIMNCNLLLIDTVKFVSLLILHFVDTILDFFEGTFSRGHSQNDIIAVFYSVSFLDHVVLDRAVWLTFGRPGRLTYKLY